MRASTLAIISALVISINTTRVLLVNGVVEVVAEAEAEITIIPPKEAAVVAVMTNVVAGEEVVVEAVDVAMISLLPLMMKLILKRESTEVYSLI